MAVYFIQATESGHIKIGYSVDPSARLAQLQTGHFDKLVLLGQVAGDQSVERMLHVRFAAWRMNGTEWFRGCNEVWNGVEELLNPGRPPVIYFAGKVGDTQSDYRVKLFRRWVNPSATNPMRAAVREYTAEFGCNVGAMKFIYGGPFSLSSILADEDDGKHGGVIAVNMNEQLHGAATHGNGLVFIDETTRWDGSVRALSGVVAGQSVEIGFRDDGNHGCWSGDFRASVNRLCLEQVLLCDVVHAFIDSFDCFGTLIELGWATARGKPVHVHFGPAMNVMQQEFWFLSHSPNVKVHHGGPDSFWRYECERIQTNKTVRVLRPRPVTATPDPAFGTNAGRGGDDVPFGLCMGCGEELGDLESSHCEACNKRV